MPDQERFDLWTWEKSKQNILTLPGRLGFPKENVLRFLDLEVNLEDGNVTDTTLNQPFDPKIEYIFFLLHQYAKAKEVTLKGDLITYRQISGGRVYAPVFDGRVIKPIEKWFGKNPKLFEKAAKRLGGKSRDLGDLAYVIHALPRVPYTYVMWEADEEFPARFKVLLDGSAALYLDAEAHAHLASLTTLRLLAVAKVR